MCTMIHRGAPYHRSAARTVHRAAIRLGLLLALVGWCVGCAAFIAPLLWGVIIRDRLRTPPLISASAATRGRTGAGSPRARSPRWSW